MKLLYKLYNKSARLLISKDILHVSLNLKSIKQKAVKVSGYDDFGDTSFNDGLKILIDSGIKEANLTNIGRLSLHNNVVNFLSSRLSLYHELKINPTTFQSEIKAPLVIAGLPRTGTSILQSLLALDSQFRTPLVWEFNLLPEPPEVSGNETRINRSKKNIEHFKALVPKIDKMHLYEANSPEECIMAMALNFDSIAFEVMYDMPSYQNWYDSSDKSKTFELHKMVLQYLQKNIATERWLLKSPSHISEFSNLFKTYPDAMVIHTHRHPNNTIPSLASIYYNIRSAFGRETDKQKTGKEMMEIWSKRLYKGLRFIKENPDKKDQFYHLDFSDLMLDPINTVKNIYTYFKLDLTENTIRKMEAFLVQNKRSKKGKHEYTLDEFGVNAEDLNLHFKDYIENFISADKNYA